MGELLTKKEAIEFCRLDAKTLKIILKMLKNLPVCQEMEKEAGLFLKKMRSQDGKKIINGVHRIGYE